jgi:threonine aldolase
MIDLRSDVVTRAPEKMLEAMSEAKCENNSALDDFETLDFEDRLAKLFNKESALFFVSAAMANLAAVLLYTKPGSEIIIASTSHSVERESASFARIAGVQTRQIFTESGLFAPQQGKPVPIQCDSASEKAHNMSPTPTPTSSSSKTEHLEGGSGTWPSFGTSRDSLRKPR